MTVIEPVTPIELANLDLRPRGTVHPSPGDWRDQVVYFLLPDRFSDGKESEKPLFDAQNPTQFAASDKRAWMNAGKNWQGGNLKGVQSKLGYLQDLGVTALWIGPVWKQRAELDTYHGYGIQNFLEIDPRFGTRQDLRDLVDAAHARGMFVILDIIYNHTGNNWFYDNNGQAWDSMPYRFQPPYPVHSWRSGTGEPTLEINSLEDGAWPKELQDLTRYTRAGSIGSWDAAGWEDPMNPNVEFRRGDFFSLKDIDLTQDSTLAAMIKVYQYWIAVSDCDGYRIDTVKHIPWESSRQFCASIHEYAEAIGKENFWLVGEVTGGEYMERSYLEINGRNLDAILDIGESREHLRGLATGMGNPNDFFAQYDERDTLGSHREAGHFHVSILDDHDMVGGLKRRFAANNHIPALYSQAAHAVGVMLTTLGVPCIYYGMEQTFDGGDQYHDYSIEPGLSFEDRYIRESMFGGTFGAFGTSGCQFFNPDHPTYKHIAAINQVRNRKDLVGLALRRGRQYLRDTTNAAEQPFSIPRAGEIVAWSRIMFDQEVVVVLNTHGTESRQALINVDAVLNPAGRTLIYQYHSDRLNQSETLMSIVETMQGRSAIRVELPPAGMAILT